MGQGLWWDGGIALACCAWQGGWHWPCPIEAIQVLLHTSCLGSSDVLPVCLLLLFGYSCSWSEFLAACSQYSCLTSGACWWFSSLFYLYWCLISFSHPLCFPWKCLSCDFFSFFFTILRMVE